MGCGWDRGTVEPDDGPRCHYNKKKLLDACLKYDKNKTVYNTLKYMQVTKWNYLSNFCISTLDTKVQSKKSYTLCNERSIKKGKSRSISDDYCNMRSHDPYLIIFFLFISPCTKHVAQPTYACFLFIGWSTCCA